MVRWQWAAVVAGLVFAVTFGTITREMGSAHARDRLGDRGAVDVPRAGSVAGSTRARAARASVETDMQIAVALSAAPPEIGRDAAVATIERGSLRILRSGSSEFTCLPDQPQTPQFDPVCVDGTGLPWAVAWWSGKPYAGSGVGVGYMLATESPDELRHAQDEGAGRLWPHLMILNARALHSAHPSAPVQAGHPFVMWRRSPFAHLMVPLRHELRLSEAPAAD